MRLLYMFLFLASIMANLAHSYERSDAFIVRLYDKRIKVLAPSKYDPKLNVILENKTLVNSVSRLERANGELITFISVGPGKFKATKLKTKKGEVLYLVPISPPFQKIELITGRRPYEIPPQR